MAGSRSLAHHVLMASVAILVGGILTTAHPTVDVLRSHSVVHSGRVMASQQTRRELGVERWVVYAEARTYGLRVVGHDDRGSLRGSMIFTLSYPPGATASSKCSSATATWSSTRTATSSRTRCPATSGPR